MGIEIERRFFIDGRENKPWRGGNSIPMLQYYLSNITHNNGVISWNGVDLVQEDDEISNISTWRIRLEGEKVVLTAKGLRTGASATEFEWDLSRSLFDSLDFSALPSVKKTRYLWNGEDGLLWEVDEFEGGLAGLVIAEVELESEDQKVIIPEWCGMELTGLRGWSNASLARMINDANSLKFG